VRLVVLSIVALSACGAQPAAAAHRATVYRDTWGVPHVYADAPEDAAYALGYAQAEDRLADIYVNVRTAVGSLAEAFGPQLAERDYMMRLVRNAEQCQQYWDSAPANLRALGDSFMRGVETYAREHPDKIPPFALELHGWHCAAIQRAMILNWPIEAVMQDLGRKAESPAAGSNAFALSPQRSAEGCAVLMADPHLPWEGMAVSYEARVHTRDYNQCGFWLLGTPLPAVGHTGHVSWAYCLGSPDTADVYTVKLNPNDPLEYEYNGAWRRFDVRTAAIAVKDQAPIEKTFLYSIYGPVVGEPDMAKGIAYCGASPYFDAPRLFDQSYRMSIARDCGEFYAALGMMQMMGVNISFADTKGAIQYVRNGATPIRPAGYNWSAPVPGGTDATRWKGIHGIGDLVQIKDPPQGYFVNCNISPANMMPGSPMTQDKYTPYIYNVTWDTMTARGVRLRELLDADASLTKDEIMAYTLDVHKVLDGALAAGRPAGADADFDAAVDCIRAWDGQFARDSAAAPIVRYWRVQCEKSGLPLADIVRKKPLAPADQHKLLDALSAAIAQIKKTYGRTDVVWGDINVVGRGGKYFPCPGTEFGPNDQNTLTQTVMAFATRENPEGPGKFVGSGGSSSTLITFLRPEGIESYSLVNWGQSGDPASPHYLDQAEKLYAERKFKPTWFRKEDLLQHVESETTLTVTAP